MRADNSEEISSALQFFAVHGLVFVVLFPAADWAFESWLPLYSLVKLLSMLAVASPASLGLRKAAFQLVLPLMRTWSLWIKTRASLLTTLVASKVSENRLLLSTQLG